MKEKASKTYRRVSLNLHRIKDARLIDWLDEQKQGTNVSYSDVLRMLMLEKMENNEYKRLTPTDVVEKEVIKEIVTKKEVNITID